jgi:uncharacterized protein YuzE
MTNAAKRKYSYDEQSDSLFIAVREGEEESIEEIAPGINIELDKNNDVIGRDILHASRWVKELKRPIPAQR